MPHLNPGILSLVDAKSNPKPNPNHEPKPKPKPKPKPHPNPNPNPNPNEVDAKSSKFNITFRKSEELDGWHAVFGKVS